MATPGGDAAGGMAAQALPAYAELHCRSNFSFLTGASHPEELVARAHELGYAALAITDECSLAGVVRAHGEARRRGLHLIVGAEMRLAAGGTAGGAAGGAATRGDAAARGGAAAPRGPDAAAHGGARLLLLAQSRRGYGNLAQWITVARRRADKGRYVALASDVEGRVPHAPYLAGLPDCFALLVIDPLLPFEAQFAHAMWLKTWFGPGRSALAVELLLRAHDAACIEQAERLAALTGLGIVAAGDVLMHVRARKPLQDALTATRLGLPVADCGFALEPNAEAHLRPRPRLAALYPAPWLEATVRIAAGCAFSLDELRYEYPEEIVPEGHTPTSWLRALTETGARRRFAAGVPPKVRAGLEHELALIAQLRYEPYFLTVADVVSWARGQGILCQGRGSAANSAVCYCLGITEVDPARAELLFERFVSAERNEPPDIDVDFEHQRREEVIQYIYRKYGRHRAALTAVVISYRPRSALRDIGRALGLDPDRIAAVARGHGWGDHASAPAVPAPGTREGAEGAEGAEVAEVAEGVERVEGAEGAPAAAAAHPGARRGLDAARLREAGFDPDAPICRLWIELTQTLVGFPRHLSQHPGGFVIARDDVSRLVPVENAAMDGRTVIQWDKDDLDALGLIKVDVLALGMLSAIRHALAFIAQKKEVPEFRMQDIPPEDPAVYRMLGAGDSVGVFQVESRAQMSMLPRLKPKNFYDLVIEVAIVRPGPIQGGMVHPYLKRRSGEEPVDYPSAEVRRALERTLGVPIFQEQVMQLAILAADFTPGEADALRRAMAAWKRKGGLGPFHARLVGRMVDKGYTREFAERIFRQIEGFGEYGFPESHAASFALLVYVSAWIKCHHPDAFLAALLDSQPMGFYAPAQLVRDARAHGVPVRPVDVLASRWTSQLEPPAGAAATPGFVSGLLPSATPNPTSTVTTAAAPAMMSAARVAAPMPAPAPGAAPWPVRLGFNRLLGFTQAAAERVIAARGQRPFDSVEDLARRAALDAHAMQLLSQGDALAPLVGHRHQAAWATAGVDTRASAMLAGTRTHEAPAVLPAPAAGEDVVADYRSVGLSLKCHPLALLREQLAAFRVQPAAVLGGYRSGQLARASGLVTHRQRPETAKGVVFVTLEDETGAVNVIVWPQVARAQRTPLLASTLLTVYGVWQCEGEVRHLIARRLVDHSALLQGLVARSRNFR